MIAIEDPALPRLGSLTREVIGGITGADEVEVLRMRYRPGARAVLHVSCRKGDASPVEGAIWFFAGSKGRDVAAASDGARFDHESAAVYECFPADHRLPEIARFLAGHHALAPRLVGGRLIGAPELVRYRPGLSCSFRVHRTDGVTRYVKIARDTDPLRTVIFAQQMSSALDGSALRIAGTTGHDCDLRAVTYEEATGQPLDRLLERASPRHAWVQVGRVVDGLREFWRLPLTPRRVLDAKVLMARAEDAHSMVSAMAPAAAPLSRAVLSALSASCPRPRLRPIHADIKLEHVFLASDIVTLVDTDSVSLGDPDLDLAQLDGRLRKAVLDGQIDPTVACAARRRIRLAHGPSFHWYRKFVALRLAKFYAQRPGFDGSTAVMKQLLTSSLSSR